MPTSQAMRMAEEADLDLVLISPNQAPPVAKIFEYVMNEVEKNKKIIEKTQLGDENVVIRINTINDFVTEYTDIYFKRIK